MRPFVVLCLWARHKPRDAERFIEFHESVEFIIIREGIGHSCFEVTIALSELEPNMNEKRKEKKKKEEETNPLMVSPCMVALT